MTNEIYTTNKIEMHVDVASLASNEFRFKINLSGDHMENATHDDIARLLQRAMHMLLYQLDNKNITESPTPQDF